MSFDQQEYLDAYIDVLRALDIGAVARIAGVLHQAWREQRTVFCCGNGGSAASAGHFVADLVKLTAPRQGPRLRALALTDSMAAVSAIANDVAYEQVFAEQLRALLSPRDVVIGFSTSGSSPNVLRAIEYANEAGAITVGVTGLAGVPLGRAAAHTLYVDSLSVQHVEDATMVVAHLLCLLVKEHVAHAQSELDRAQGRLRLEALRPAASL